MRERVEGFSDGEQDTRDRLLDVLTLLKGSLFDKFAMIDAIVANSDEELKELRTKLDRIDHNIDQIQQDIVDRLDTYDQIVRDVKFLKELTDDGQEELNYLLNTEEQKLSLKSDLNTVYSQSVNNGTLLLQTTKEEKAVLDNLLQQKLVTAEATKQIKCFDSCKSIFDNVPDVADGIYTIYPPGFDAGLQVQCDMKNGGWTIVRRRSTGVLDFNRNWDEQEKGFGATYSEEYWLGLRAIHALTKAKPRALQLQYRVYADSTWYVSQYKSFALRGPEVNYKIEVYGFQGTGVDSLSKNIHNEFTTVDRDNDLWGGGNCAAVYGGPWWFGNCNSGTGNTIVQQCRNTACHNTMEDYMKIL